MQPTQGWTGSRLVQSRCKTIEDKYSTLAVASPYDFLGAEYSGSCERRSGNVVSKEDSSWD